MIHIDEKLQIAKMLAEMQSLVEAQLKGSILTVRLKRAEKRNALSRPMLGELKSKFLEWAINESVRVAVLIGDGDRAFASGGDLKELMVLRALDEARQFADASRAALESIRCFPVPVIAALNGDALGGGAELAMACDLRFAAPNARIGFLQASLGISTAWGGGTDLMRLVGPAQALELLCSAEILSAQQALSMKLVGKIASVEEPFETQVMHYAEGFAKRPRQVIRAFKALAIAYRQGASPEVMADVEGSNLAQTWVHEDHWAAVAAAFPPR